MSNNIESIKLFQALKNRQAERERVERSLLERLKPHLFKDIGAAIWFVPILSGSVVSPQGEAIIVTGARWEPDYGYEMIHKKTETIGDITNITEVGFSVSPQIDQIFTQGFKFRQWQHEYLSDLIHLDPAHTHRMQLNPFQVLRGVVLDLESIV